MIVIRKLLPVIVLLAVHLQDVNGQGYGYAYGYNSPNPYNDDEYKSILYSILNGRNEVVRPVTSADIYENLITKQEIYRNSNLALQHEIWAAKLALARGSFRPNLYSGRMTPLHRPDLVTYDKIINTRREETAADEEPDMLEFNDYLARTGSLDQLPSLELTLPEDFSLLTRSGKEELDEEVQKALRDLKEQLQSLAAGSTRKQSSSKITIDQQFSNSIIESVINSAKHQIYRALKNWVQTKMIDLEKETPPKLDE